MFPLIFRIYPRNLAALHRWTQPNPIIGNTNLKLNLPIAAMGFSNRSSNNDRVKLSKSLTLIQNKSLTNNADAQRTLVLIFSWMLAKDKHIEKFNDFYAKYGYDVLIIRTAPLQLMFPSRGGSIENAERILRFVESKHDYYSRLIVHGFSVGAYQFGEFLDQLSQNPTLSEKISPKFKAMIFDSAANLAAIPDGFSRALTTNRILQKLLCQMLHFYLWIFYPIATKYYEVSQREFYQMNHFIVPSLMLLSERDTVGSVAANKDVADSWVKRGVPIKMKVWKDSLHVGHYNKHRDEYEQELKQLIEQINK